MVMLLMKEEHQNYLYIDNLENSIAEYKDIKFELNETIKELISNGNINNNLPNT